MNALDILKYGDLTLLRTLEHFPVENGAEPGACGYWSVNDIVAHLTSYELMLAEVLANVIDGSPMPLIDAMAVQGDRFNDLQVAARAELTSQQLFMEYGRAHARVMQLAAQIEPETFRANGTIPWYGAGYCLDDFIVYTNYAHKREHCGQIDVFGDRFRATP